MIPADASSVITNLGLAGFAMFILWKMAIMFVQREREKDGMHAKEREEQAKQHRAERDEWAKRMDARDVAFRALESDIRNTFAATVAESGSVIKKAVIYMTKRAGQRRSK